MDLPPDKAKFLKQYDDEKKWDIICDQVRQTRSCIVIFLSFCFSSPEVKYIMMNDDYTGGVRYTVWVCVAGTEAYRIVKYNQILRRALIILYSFDTFDDSCIYIKWQRSELWSLFWSSYIIVSLLLFFLYPRVSHYFDRDMCQRVVYCKKYTVPMDGFFGYTRCVLENEFRIRN